MTALLAEPVALADDPDVIAELRTLSDADLAGLADSALAEPARTVLRQRAAERARQRRRQDPVSREWFDAAYAQYLRAEQELCGVLLNARGKAKCADAFDLWSGPAWMAEMFASWELLRFWESEPRVTVTEYRRQNAQAEETYRDDQDRADYDRQHVDQAGTDALDPDGARPVRPGPEAHAGRADSGAGPVRHEPDVRPGRDVVKTACKPSHRDRPANGIPQCSDCPEPPRAGSADRLAELRQRSAQRRAERELATTAPAPGTTVAVRPSGTIAGQVPDIDGAELLDHVDAYLARYAHFPSASARHAVALWVAHTHARDRDGVLIWPATPRLMMLSAAAGSGKSTVLELVGRLVPSCGGLDVEPTPAGVIYALGSEHSTVCLDEGDVLFGSGKRKQSLRAILNAGYSRSGTYLRMRGNTGERVSVFGPIALAGLDVLEKATGDTLAPLLSRSIIVRMVPPPPGTGIADLADPYERADERAEIGRRQLAIWALVNRDALRAARPDLPDGVRLRDAQIWRPLLAIADVAGGDWPALARAACAELVNAYETQNDGPTEVSLADELAAMTAGW